MDELFDVFDEAPPPEIKRANKRDATGELKSEVAATVGAQPDGKASAKYPPSPGTSQVEWLGINARVEKTTTRGLNRNRNPCYRYL